MECKTYPFGTIGAYQYACVFASYKGKWIFCKHKDRDTWEHPGGHIEPNETALQAAKRELFEETGALAFDIVPVCDYQIHGELNGVEIAGRGQVYYADVSALADIPTQSEIERIDFFDTPPQELTYPEFTRAVFPRVLREIIAIGTDF